MFGLDYISWFKSLPPELATMIIAMVPIAELRVSIPVALGIYKLSIFSAIFWSVVGDMIPMAFILFFIRPVSDWLMKRFKFWNRFFNWLFERTRKKFGKKHTRFGQVALVLFVGIPLPITGCWTGALAAFLFDIPVQRAFFLITIGIVMAGIIVTLITTGVFSFFNFII